MRKDFDYSNVQPHTTPTSPNTTPKPRKIFDVEGYGPVPLENSVWFYCTDRTALKDMQVGDEIYFTFQSGMGKSDLLVKRIQ